MKTIYDSQQPDDAKRKAKSETIGRLRRDYQEMKTRWGGYSGYDQWFSKPLNNAQLNTVATYHDLVPAFQRLLASHGGNLESFYKEVEQLKKLSKDERRQRLATRQS